MLTAERDVSRRSASLRAGADDYLVKPFHPAELLARMKSLLARFAPSKALVGRQPLGRVHAYYGARAAWAPPRSRSTPRSRSSAVGRTVCLVDGNLQFGDHRVFLDLGLDRKSDRRRRQRPGDRADLIRQVWSRATSRASTCCSPRPRPESADLVTPGAHATRSLELLRGLYDYVIVDIDKRLDDIKLDGPRRRRDDLRRS